MIYSDNFAADVLDSDLPVLVDFYADWCAPCRALTPKLDLISQEREDSLRVVKVNVEDHPDVAAEYGIQALPTLMRFERGQIVQTHVGFPVDDTLQKLVK